MKILTEDYSEKYAGEGNHKEQIVAHPLGGVSRHLAGTLRGRDVLPAHLREEILGEARRGLLLHFTGAPG